MGELSAARSLIHAFIGKNQPETKAESSTNEPSAIEPVTTPGNVDTTKVTKEADASTAKAKRPALKVIQGGAKGLAASTPTISDLPTPGGIGLLLLIILFLLFTVAKTGNGKTRLQTIWAVLSGHASFGGQTPLVPFDPSHQYTTPTPPQAFEPGTDGSWGPNPADTAGWYQ